MGREGDETMGTLVRYGAVAMAVLLMLARPGMAQERFGGRLKVVFHSHADSHVEPQAVPS